MEYENMLIAEFLSENWVKFEQFCESKGEAAADIYSAVSDED